MQSLRIPYLSLDTATVRACGEPAIAFGKRLVASSLSANSLKIAHPPSSLNQSHAWASASECNAVIFDWIPDKRTAYWNIAKIT